MRAASLYTCDGQEFLRSENREDDLAHRRLCQRTSLGFVGNAFAVDCQEIVALYYETGGSATVRHVGHNHLIVECSKYDG